MMINLFIFVKYKYNTFLHINEMNCVDIVSKLIQSVYDCNTMITDNMTEQNVTYEYACMRPDITFNNYFAILQSKWETIINEFINKPEKCSSGIQSIILLHDLISKDGESFDLNKINGQKVEQLVYDKIIDMIKNTSESSFKMDENMIITVKRLISMFLEHCTCQMADIFSLFVSKYKSKYGKKLDGKTREESLKILTNDYHNIKIMMSKFVIDLQKFNVSNNVSNNVNKSIFSKSSQISSNDGLIETELNKLIPEELGSMKIFFIKVISRYYNNLHPIIWAQIFKGILANIFIDLPFTTDELFSFLSKQLLLNSGPFILKILQMIRPVLPDDIAQKYNLTKLTYPLLEKFQVQLILKKIMPDYDMFKIVFNKSASVGHVCIGYDVRSPNDKFVIKIVKPLAISQSCWEYYILRDLFPKDSCEDKFIKNTLKSNGAEMNVEHEINNLNRGFENYTSDYNNEFGINIKANLTTIQHRKNVIKEGTWFALATTLAEGIPVADLVESKLLEKDTKFRANLHRCLDILVSKFFYVLINKGFYHGDLHSGNIFYSFKNKLLTMIDFGAMGDIDLFTNDETTTSLLKIIIMSANYDFDGVFDELTDILNAKCSGDSNNVIIDKFSPEYLKLKKELIAHKLKNIINADKEDQRQKIFLHDLDGNKRHENEYDDNIVEDINDDKAFETIYDNFDRKMKESEVVIENRDELPVFTEIIGDSESITFAGIMQLIAKFYSLNGINIAVKFSELNELQKAYVLLLGVLSKTGYNSYRMNMAIKNGVLTWGHLPKVVNVGTTYNIIKSYWSESTKQTKMKNLIKDERIKRNI